MSDTRIIPHSATQPAVPLEFPFTYVVAGRGGADAFRIEARAIVSADPETRGGWYIDGILIGGQRIDEATVVGEHQAEAMLFFVLAHHKTQIQTAWLAHLAHAPKAGGRLHA